MPVTYSFLLPDIRCAACVYPIEQSLQKLDTQGICCEVDLLSKQLAATVSSDVAYMEVRRLIETELETIGVACEAVPPVEVLSPLNTITPTLWNTFLNRLHSHGVQGIIGVSLGFLLLMLSPMMGVLSPMVMMTITGLSVVLTLVLGAQSYQEAVVKWVKTRTLTMDALFAMSSLTVIAVSVASFFFPWLPMMADAGLLIFGFRHLGLAIEESLQQAMVATLRFCDRLPKAVWLQQANGLQQRPLSAVKLGDRVLLHAGDLIPVDGLLVEIIPNEKNTLYKDVDIVDTILTGSLLPRPVSENTPLIAGMYVAEGSPSLVLQATSSSAQSYLAKLDEHHSLGHGEKAPLEIETTRMLQYFIPTVIAIALAAFVGIHFFFSTVWAIQCAVALLVSACPCTLGFITPLAIKIGMHKAASHGVLFKSAKQLQQADQIDDVVFDLNGTLTVGLPRVESVDVVPASHLTPDELIAYCVLLEQQSMHPIAKALRDFAKQESIVLDDNQLLVAQWDDGHHAGVKATLDGIEYVLGNEHMMRFSGVSDGFVLTEDVPGRTVIYLARQQQIVGHVMLNDVLRPHAYETVHALHRLGKRVHLCTGSDDATARYFAHALGIPLTHVHAAHVNDLTLAALCDKKQQLIESLKQQGRRVAMIGDAGNDSSAMCASHFGIVVKSYHSDAMTERHAGAVVQNASLLPIANAFVIATKTIAHVRQNLRMSLGYNLVTVVMTAVLLLGFGVVLNPAVGVVLMIVQSSLILLNSHRFKQQTVARSQVQEQALPEVNSPSSYAQLLPRMTNEYPIKRTPSIDASESPSWHSPMAYHAGNGAELPERDNEVPTYLLSARS